MSDKYEIYEYEDGFKLVLKNGKAVNKFGLLKDIKKLQSENAEFKRVGSTQVRKVLCEIGTEFENDTRIDKKSMPFVRAIVINKIYDYPTPPEGE